MINFKKFIKEKLVSNKGILITRNIFNRLERNGFKNEKELLEKSNNIQKDIYDLFYDIKDTPKCECGNNLKFRSFSKGYHGCCLGCKCPLLRKQSSIRNTKLDYDLKWILNNLKIDTNHDIYENEILSFLNYLNTNKIKRPVARLYSKWIRNYISFGVKNWVKRIKITQKSLDNGIIISKDSSSLKSFMIRYGKTGKKLFNEKNRKVTENVWNNCLKTSSSYEEAMEKYNFIKFKKSMSLESFIYRCNGDKVLAKEKYDKYWNNTTFSISKQRFKNVYGNQWEKYYNERIKLHRNANLKNLIYNSKTCEITEDEFEQIKKERYKKSSFNSKKSQQIKKLKTEGMTKEEIEDIFKFRWSHGLKYYIEKYGEKEGTDKFNKYCEKIRKSSFSLENFIEKYGEEEGTNKFNKWRKRCICNKENLIKKYGEEEGTNKFNKWIKNNGIGKASKMSMNVFFPLIDWLLENEICILNDIYVGINNSKEYYLNKHGKCYLYDFTIPSLNIIIEYNGEHVHPNPKWLNEDINKWNNWCHAFSKKPSEIIYKENQDKINFAIKCGFKMLELWSSDKDECNLNKCKQFIRSNL